MKYFALLFCILMGGKGLSQVSLPEETAKIMVDQYILGYQTGDSVRMKSMANPNLTLQIVFLSEDQENKLLYIDPSALFKHLASHAPQEKWEVKLLDYIVESDGNLGHIWTPFMYYKNGKFTYCGAFSFTVTYTDDSWKILNIVESRRIGGCLDGE